MNLRTRTVSVLVAAWAISCAVVSSAAISSSHDWQFTSGDNPAAPTFSTNSNGTASATFSPGFASTGWQESLPGFGSRAGLWDMGGQNPGDNTGGSRGKLLLTIPNPVGGDLGGETELTVHIVQFTDGLLYTGNLSFSLPGATNLGRTVVEMLYLVPGGGAWVEDKVRWRLAPSPGTVSLVITGAVMGTLLDGVRVEAITTESEVPPPVITSAAKVNDTLQITWTGGRPPYQLFRATSLAPAAAWEPVGALVSGTSSSINIDDTYGLIRVAGSN
jgi:hypothetical protein